MREGGSARQREVAEDRTGQGRPGEDYAIGVVTSWPHCELPLLRPASFSHGPACTVRYVGFTAMGVNTTRSDRRCDGSKGGKRQPAGDKWKGKKNSMATKHDPLDEQILSQWAISAPSSSAVGVLGTLVGRSATVHFHVGVFVMRGVGALSADGHVGVLLGTPLISVRIRLADSHVGALGLVPVGHVLGAERLVCAV